jgi:hypothetical protein
MGQEINKINTEGSRQKTNSSNMTWRVSIQTSVIILIIGFIAITFFKLLEILIKLFI